MDPTCELQLKGINWHNVKYYYADAATGPTGDKKPGDKSAKSNGINQPKVIYTQIPTGPKVEASIGPIKEPDVLIVPNIRFDSGAEFASFLKDQRAKCFEEQIAYLNSIDERLDYLLRWEPKIPIDWKEEEKTRLQINALRNFSRDTAEEIKAKLSELEHLIPTLISYVNILERSSYTSSSGSKILIRIPIAPELGKYCYYMIYYMLQNISSKYSYKNPVYELTPKQIVIYLVVMLTRLNHEKKVLIEKAVFLDRLAHDPIKTIEQLRQLPVAHSAT